MHEVLSAAPHFSQSSQRACINGGDEAVETSVLSSTGFARGISGTSVPKGGDETSMISAWVYKENKVHDRIEGKVAIKH